MFFFIAFLVIMGFIIWGCSQEETPEQFAEKSKPIDEAIKRKYGIDCKSSIRIDDVLCIDKSKNLIFLAYMNTKTLTDHQCLINVNQVCDYGYYSEYLKAVRPGVGILGKPTVRENCSSRYFQISFRVNNHTEFAEYHHGYGYDKVIEYLNSQLKKELI